MRLGLPFPLLTAALLAMWLLLNESAGVGSIVLGAALAILACLILTALDPPTARLRRPGAAVKLMLVVVIEIARSNYAVARIILGAAQRKRRSGFVRIPLDARSPYSLAALACIVTATPGTIWIEYDSTDHTMLLHVLDLVDEDHWVTIIKERYEKRLREIFE